MNQMQHDLDYGPVAVQDYGELLGTPFSVYLYNGVTVHIDSQSGETVADITDLPGLIAAIVQSRVLNPRKMSGKDLRYIRSALCLRSKQIAASLDMSAEHYSRCESGTKAMSSEKEKFYRMYVYLSSFIKDKGVRNAISEMEQKPKASPDEAEKALSAFQKIFLEMKIHSVHAAGERLAFEFCRGKGYPDRENADDKWIDDSDKRAA